MKKLILLHVFCSMFIVTVTGQDRDSIFKSVLIEKIAILDTANSKATFETLNFDFNRLAIGYKKSWEAYYYAGFCQLTLAFYAGDKEESFELMQVAKGQLDSAASISKKNSEIMALLSRLYLYMIPMGDIMKTGPKYTPIAKMYADKSIAINPDNPRAHMSLAIYYSRVPSMFGGDESKSCEYVKQSLKLYDSVATNNLDPHWGKERALLMLKECDGGK